MSGIVVVWQRDGAPVAPRVVHAMLAPSPHLAQDGQCVWAQGCVALAHQHFWVTPEEVGEEQPLANEQGTVVLTCDGRLDNRPELIAALGLEPPKSSRLSDAHLILRAFERWGEDCAGHLLGDFAFAVWDAERQRMFLARDALGACGLCYYDNGRLFLAATEIKQILAHPAVQPILNETKVADYLAGLWHNQEDTFYKGIFYCPPGEGMVVEQGREVRRRRYWQIDPTRRIRYRRSQEYGEHLRSLLTEAVRCRLRTAGPIGLSLSGGLDSTSLAALASRELAAGGGAQGRLKTFSYVFDELKTCDERRWIEPVVQHCDLEASYIVGDELWPLRDIERWPVIRDWVFHDAYAWLPIAVRREAQRAGCKVLWVGYYGDTLFCGDQFWLASMLQEGQWRQAAALWWQMRLTPQTGSVPVSPGVRPLVPLALRQAYRRWRPRPVVFRHAGLHPDLIARTHLTERCAAASNGHSWPAVGQGERYRALLQDASFAQGNTVARQIANEHGLELVDPYQDRRLVEFVLAVPAEQMGWPGWTKRILRQAMVGLLPETVRTRRGKTTFYPLFERGLGDRSRETVRNLMTDAEIVRRGFVQNTWLQEQVAQGPPWQADGYFLWLCISLELWLRRYWSRDGDGPWQRSPVEWS